MAYTREQHNQWRAIRTTRLRKIIEDAKNVPCMDCGISYPHYVMDFDHVRGEKKFNVAQCVGKTTSIKALILEIEKCEIICSNCHRIRTFERKNGRKPNTG